MQNFVCALQDWRLCFSQSSGSPIIKSCWPQDQIPWRFPVPLSDPQAGKPDVGFRTFTAVQDFFGIIVLQSVGHPPGGYGIWFYYDCTLLPCHYSFLFVFGHGVSFFGGFRHPSVNSCSTASCYFGALAGDEHTSFYFAILNQKFPIYSWCRLINSECILSHCSTPLFGYVHVWSVHIFFPLNHLRVSHSHQIHLLFHPIYYCVYFLQSRKTFIQPQ